MAKNINNKKALAEQIKAKLNSPDYVAMPDLITYDNRIVIVGRSTTTSVEQLKKFLICLRYSYKCLH